MKKITDQVLTESFTGAANYEEEARSHADIKYFSWKTFIKRQKKAAVEEVSKSYTLRQVNGAYCKCELTVSYKLGPAK
jgi:hypothetical protein